MAIGRSRYAPPYTSSTKGHSVLKQRSYAMSPRTPPTTGVSRASGAAYDTRAEEHFLADRVSNVNYLSNSLMDEGYDTAVRSRGRDQQLLKEATNAIVSAESYATPQASVASRRVARGQSVGQRAASVPPRSLRPEVETAAKVTVTQAAPAPQARPIIFLPPPPPPAPAPAPRNNRAMSVPPVVVREDRRQRVQVAPVPVNKERRYRARAGSVPPPAAAVSARRSYMPPPAPAKAPLPTSELRAHRVPRRFLTRTGYSSYYEKPDTVAQARATGVPYALPRPRPAPLAESLRGFPKVYVPASERPSNRSKAAIIASKLEPDPIKRRRPRSEYAANKYRELRKESLEKPSGGSPQSKSSGLYGYSSGVEGNARPVSDLRRRIRRTLNRSRVS